ncbi:MAG TPA: transglutaminase family protein [Sphingomonadaceae bacterium]|nr:transglutaminase family protein [Sphingomonadaceae bacterium]
MRLSIRHRTTYRFDQPQTRLVQLARVTPISSPGQTVLGWEVEVDRDANLRTACDGYGNTLTMLYVDGPVQEISLQVSGEVLTQDLAGVVGDAPEPLPPEVFLRASELTHADEAIRALADEIRDGGSTGIDQLHALMRFLGTRVRYDTGDMDVTRTAAQSLALGRGVCQDFAHVFIAAARELDVPTRYVSGHLFQRDGRPDQAAAHAWAESWVDGIGWIGFDPANGICPDDAYVRVAVGLDYREAAPLSGARLGGGAERLDVAVSIVQSGRQTQS